MAVASTVHLTTTLEAAGDLSDYRFHFMKNDSGQVTVAAAVTDPCVGVLQDKPEAEGRAAELVVVGETKIVAGDAIDALVLITTDTSGHAVAVTPGSDTTCYILGRALEAAGATGDIIRAFVNCANPARAA
jgi:hypothetical protein